MGTFPRGEKGGLNLFISLPTLRRSPSSGPIHHVAMAPRMKKKELRFALVCYGGVSLALYMHGVIKEILKLSRASKAYHSVPQSEQREHRSYEAANGDDGRPRDT